MQYLNYRWNKPRHNQISPYIILIKIIADKKNVDELNYIMCFTQYTIEVLLLCTHGDLYHDYMDNLLFLY